AASEAGQMSAPDYAPLYRLSKILLALTGASTDVLESSANSLTESGHGRHHGEASLSSQSPFG
ncbi:hypothetical protein, partial [Mesorhizobium sp. M0684]|uniref:hypothetical protein n=1 Tax=Mesorhizobium sp. M0684 TaxID=2956986 RepID=UPI00333A5F8F